VNERVVLGRRGDSSMVKIRWSDAAPQALNEISEAEELGAVWEGNELVTYDLVGFCDLFEYYTDNTWLPDND
jgi:predicted alpha/beta-fold hydrolase